MALPEKQTNPLKKFISFIIIVVVFFLGKFLWKLSEENSVRSRKSAKIEMEQIVWNQIEIDSTRLFIETPAKLQTITSEVPDFWIGAVSELKIYKLSFQTFKGQIMTALFENAEINIEGKSEEIAQGGIDNLKQAPGVTEVNIKSENTSINGLAATLMTGTYKLSGMDKEIKAVFFVEDARMWNFFFSFNAGDHNSIATADRIIQSIQIFDQ